MQKEYKIIINLILSLLFYFSAFTQANSWIDYNKQYFKIHISADGIYRISYSELLNAGVPVNQIDPRGIQLFYRGEEQYIYIKGESSTGIFDPSGYIEFYGIRNRGDDDLEFFDSPDSRVNNDYSFYNDTSVYFLTWSYSTGNRRFAVENDNNFSTYVSFAQEYCLRKIRTNYVSTYYWGSTRNPFTEGEGWFDNSVITETNPVTKTISVPNFHSSLVPAVFEIAVVGVPANQVTSNVPHHLKVNFLGQERINRTYTGYQFVRESISVPSNQLTNNISIQFSANDATQPNIPDRNAVSYIQIIYPHTWDFENKNHFEFYLPANFTTEKDYLEISNFASGNEYILYDLTNHKRISIVKDQGLLKALVSNTSSLRFLVLVNEAGIKSVDRITKVSNDNKFTNYFDQFKTSDYVIVTNKSLWSSAQQYANYRASKGMNVALVDIDHLCDQYAYGVGKHPVAIRRFIEHLYSFNQRPRMLFLLGKSLHTRLYRKDSARYAECLVPSAGNPSSDNLLTAGLGLTHFEPLFGTGRLSARNNEEVLSYLNKVIEYESNLPAEWMKYVVHFGGGSNANEQNTFASYLNNYKNIIEDTLFGARVSTFLKTSSEPIQITQTDSVRNLINGGVSMMTFFGHASASGFDQDIDFPETYSNKGKYPFILANSCFSGDIHQRGSGSISERWVKAVNGGSIAFLASVGDGFSSYLNIFSNELYKNIAYKLYNRPVSFQIINAIKNLQNSYWSNLLMEITCHEFTLHGDPAIIINSHEKPDFVITPAQIALNPIQVSTVADSFEVKILIKNIGKATNESFITGLTRIFSDGSISEYSIPVDYCYFEKTVSLKLPVDRLKAPGLNTIRIYLDSGNDVDELNEDNNVSNINFLIKTGDLFPVYPYKYSIVPIKNISLIASTGNPFSEPQNYLFRIDTTDLFNSPLLRQASVQSSGGLVVWQLPFELDENTVYYWQIAAQHSNPDSIVWMESSFIYIEGEEGWSQAHFFQFKENSFHFIDYDRVAREFRYVDYPRRLVCKNTGSYWIDGYEFVSWKIDGSIGNGLGDFGNCGTAAAMLVAVIDPETLLAWPSNIQDYGHRNYPQCFSSIRPQYFFSFSTGSGNTVNYESLENFENMLNDIPDGHYVLSYSWGNAYFRQWPESLYQTFESLGSVNIRNLQNGNPYIFFAKKGIPSSAQELYGNSSTDTIIFQTDLFTNFDNGFITSVDVGPSQEWQSFVWETTENEDPVTDEIRIKILGLNSQNQYEQIFPELTDFSGIIDGLADSINYQQYPNLKLFFRTEDKINKTTSQLLKWQLRYIPVPETAIDPKSGFYFCCDTIQEGEEIKFAVATKNISSRDMDSLVVKYWMQDNNNEIIPIDQRKLRNHPAGDILIDTVVYSSLNMRGINSIWVEYNPVNPLTGRYYQPEQYHFNNLAVKYFVVMRDNINPLLDVSFDGRYIMNGEIVSAKPEILIKLKDENKFLALNDTSVFRIYLTDLQKGEEQRVYFSNPGKPGESIEFFPAVLPENSCKIIYKPIFEEDGFYRLRVQAKDMSNNESGRNDYVIDFRVVTASTITRILNYPNPFSTSTRFVFELTGSEIPDELRIDIFTVSGKLVRTIFLEELGPIRIGKNITEFAWDGTDMYGDKLATGTYFYTVKAKINGKDIDLLNTQADKYFKKEVGKMYIIR